MSLPRGELLFVNHPQACPMHTPNLFVPLDSGWICYAEKTHGNFILPYISTARSPQQVMGSLIKDFFAQQQVTGLGIPGQRMRSERWPAGWPVTMVPSGGVWVTET